MQTTNYTTIGLIRDTVYGDIEIVTDGDRVYYRLLFTGDTLNDAQVSEMKKSFRKA